ncbi:class I SAM-dependent methyltransferase [Prauserella sp. PE36]|uniref:class I SAM-dependent methyltransferase n=1 Tax=Prauserella sp. PE36 TaxID=1504709 RepID=UPI000DE3B3E6|nr:class I SAM-dependent methyltransferase [Prauserella sp. PE36]RBM19270.1 class I SAM-dependent methyltransferase [Prauserella sp. PE36]
MRRNLRHALRAKLVRAVEAAQAPQLRKLERLEREVTELRRDTARLLDRVVEFEVRSRRDIVYAGDREAAAESHRFARQHLIGARHFRKPWETLRYALSLAPEGGLALEFGVASGNTLRHIAEARGGGKVYGFDSFEGLPEPWLAGMPAGAFARTDLPDVPGAELVVGLFADTLPAFLEQHGQPVDFVHVDSDLYSSAKTVLDLVGPRLRAGSVIAFDEFFNYPGWQDHEYRAWREYAERTGVQFSYEAYSYEDCQVVVRLTG